MLKLPFLPFKKQITIAKAIALGISALALGATQTTAADWVSAGPAPVVNGGDMGITSPEGANPITGSINSFAPHPTDANILYAAGVNGGVWKTVNAKSASPTWTPLTDSALPSLSISAVAVSPLDANVIFAGSGRTSSLAENGGTRFGIGRSTDGGATWTVVGTNLADRDIRSIVPTKTVEGGQVVVVAAGGIFRSTDGGVTYTSNTNGIAGQAVTDLVSDPGVTTRLYAAEGGKVYKSDDTGASWTEISTGAGFTVVADSRVLLSVHNSPGNDVVYAAVIQSGALANVYRSADQGTTWTALGVPSPAIFPGKSPQGSSQGAIVADKTNPNAVWMAGDRQPDQTEDGSNGTNQFPNTLGADGYWGNIWRNAAGTWENMAADGANGTAPHADSRAMLFNADGEIVHSCDGGIFKLNNPNGTSAPDKSGNRKWSSLNGDLRILEAHNAVFDPVAKVFMCGAQDNGVNIQQTTGSKIWTGYIGGDGGRVEVDADQTAHAGTSIRYGSSQNFGGFNRRSFDANNAPVGDATYAKLMITAGPGAGQSLTQFDKVLFLQPFVLNQINPSRMLIGTEYIFESADMGESLTNLGKAVPDTALKHAVHSAAGATRKSSGAMPSVAVRPLENEEPPADAGVAVGDDTNSGSAAMAYGGRLQGAAFPDVFYVGAGNKIAHRVTLGGAITSLSYPGSVVRVLVMDPQNYKRVFVLDKTGKVYVTNDEGVTWSNITANLGTLTTDLRTIEIFNPDQSGQKTVLYAGGLGGVWKMANPSETGNWTTENGGLPKTVLVYDLRYDYATNTLTAATLGRGVYALTGAAGSVANISTRLPIGRGDNLLITGFIVTGPTGSTKKVLVRGIGPSTKIDGALADPTLELRDNAGVVVAQNDNWKTTQTGGLITGDQSGEIQATGAAPKDDAESAIIVTLAPGAYTAQVRGAGDTVGIGVAEAYDLSIASGAQLANVSTRGNVQTGNNIMIGGFIIVNNPVKVIVRALGPSLGIDGALADPTLEVRSGDGTLVLVNDNWQDTQAAEIAATGIPPKNQAESAIVQTLLPGSYTALVRGKNDSTGVGLVELYVLQ